MAISGSRQRPGLWRRVAAIAAIALFAAAVVFTVVAVVREPLWFLAQLVLLVILALAFWDALTRPGARRWAAVAVAAVAVVAILVIEVDRDGRAGLSLVLRIGAVLAAAGLARYATARDVRTLQRTVTPGTPVPAARRGTLIMNLKSGGGKAERFHLVDECRARGVEPVVLKPGDDLLELARDAIDRGTDVIGMAGGDGSQALVASVAAARGVPMVVVPAGTRNHFALDLGMDRDDVVGALDSYAEAFEHAIDLADVNGRVFVNNVSLGLYAAIVRSPEYRDAKRETALAALPQMLGPDTEPFDLRFVGPDGERHDGAHVVQISNGPYGTSIGGLTSRPRLDTGMLGVFALMVPSGLGATQFLAAMAAGHPEHYKGYLGWNTPTLTITSASPVAVGLDGESLEMAPPLVFSSRPGALRVRLSGRAIGYSPAARSASLGARLADLCRTALGRPAGGGS
jgi:diacylglycerol kinase family enzyme